MDDPAGIAFVRDHCASRSARPSRRAACDQQHDAPSELSRPPSRRAVTFLALPLLETRTATIIVGGGGRGALHLLQGSASETNPTPDQKLTLHPPTCIAYS